MLNITEQLPEYQSEMERNKLNLQTVLFRPLRSRQCSSEYIYYYSGTPLIRPPTGQNKVVVLTGWSYYRGRVIFRSKHVLINVYFKHIRGYHAYKDCWEVEIGQVLTLQQEPTNPQDKNAIAIIKDSNVVGHMPKGLASTKTGVGII